MSTEPLGSRGRAEEQGPPVPASAPRPAPPRPSPRQSASQTAAQQAAAPPTTAQPAIPEEAAPEGAARQQGAARPEGEVAQWSQLQAQFVDDPVGAVKAASGLVEEAIQRILHRPEGDTDTEALRSAFLRYRDLHRTLSGGAR